MEGYDEFIYECSCGCGSLKFLQSKDDGWTSISYFVPAWNAAQGIYGGWKNTFKIIWNLLRGKEYCFYEIIIEDNKKLEEFKNFVANMRTIDEK